MPLHAAQYRTHPRRRIRLPPDHLADRSRRVREGECVGLGTPIKLSRTPGGLRSLPPELGASNDEYGW
ncbi:hypothetical protein [Bordetella sp. FB-8]|uniref:hypothetical protein n=1 Tax=Bordetella sp. FB-8 TaxID=1159870 RepID=UPI0012DF3189|nr:hypothetical protein [Bordetella sp. FB-8]